MSLFFLVKLVNISIIKIVEFSEDWQKKLLEDHMKEEKDMRGLYICHSFNKADLVTFLREFSQSLPVTYFY